MRHRIAQLGWDLATAGAVSGIPEGTLKNNTREPNPQPIKLRRVYALLAALNQPGHKPLAIEDILATGDGVPDGNPSEEQEQETNVGPGREGGNKGRGAKDKKAPKRVRGAAA